MDAALLLPATPASGAGIVGVEGQAGTWFAADAGVALVIQRKEWNFVAPGIVPNVLCSPLGKRADLPDCPGGGQREVLDWLQCGATLGLFATEAGEP